MNYNNSAVFRLQEWVLLASVALTPVYSYVEIYKLMMSEEINFELSELWALKVVKDILILLCLGIGVVGGYFVKRSGLFAVSKSSIFLIFVSLIASIILSYFYVTSESLLAGVRWVIPLVFFFFLDKFELAFYRHMTAILQSLLLIGLGLQIYQLFNMQAVFGENEAGYSLRNPGFFLFPSSMASFGMATLLFSSLFDPIGARRMIMHVLCGVSISMTASGAGVFAFVLFSIVNASPGAHLRRYALVAIAFSGLLLGALPFLTGRGDILTSMFTRIEIVIEEIRLSRIIFSDSFGLGTNTVHTLSPELLDSGISLISDSMITATIVNGGLFMLLFLTHEFFLKYLVKDSKPYYLYVATFFPFFLTTVIFELFPANILMFVVFAWLTEVNFRSGERGNTVRPI